MALCWRAPPSAGCSLQNPSSIVPASMGVVYGLNLLLIRMHCEQSRLVVQYSIPSFDSKNSAYACALRLSHRPGLCPFPWRLSDHTSHVSTNNAETHVDDVATRQKLLGSFLAERREQSQEKTFQPNAANFPSPRCLYTSQYRCTVCPCLMSPNT
jgi:hypothetical protein